MASKLDLAATMVGINRLSLALLVLVSLTTSLGMAQDNAARTPRALDAPSLVQLYPAGSIQSVQLADEALADVQEARSRIEARFTDEERECYSRFFVNACIDDAKERRREALNRIHKIEVEANTFKRRARVEERDKGLAEKAEKPGPTPRAAKEPKNQSESAEEAAKRAARAAEAAERAAQHQARLEQLKAEEAANVEQRAENVAKHEKKTRAAEKHQRKVAEKKAEKERQRPAGNATAAVPPVR